MSAKSTVFTAELMPLLLNRDCLQNSPAIVDPALQVSSLKGLACAIGVGVWLVITASGACRQPQKTLQSVVYRVFVYLRDRM